ncbi:serpin family protein [Thermobifida halotolerans]|uniref:Serpin family protein n=1 Tax=Thermobifida halotolerans TaxID=483545 RepID=A0A399G3Y6_9ACTN|nr:serpin family protein [Thermobifida halotolerans]UOE21727.1 serpin family protein [Thermobifida halotolerans]
MPRVVLHSDHVEFALRLHAALTGAAPDGGPGVVWSPYSVACALGLLATGARGATRDELAALLGADLDGMLAALDEAVADSPDLASRTALWVRADVPVRPAFTAGLRDRPDSDVRAADFRGDPEGVRAGVNADVAETTRGMIRELLTPGSVTADMLAILVNALWTKARWITEFQPELTRDRPFHAPAATRRTALMHRTGEMPYAETDGWRMASLHAHDELAVDVLLPPESAPSAALTAALLTALYRRQRRTRVELALPRFDLTHRRGLTEVLAAAGVRALFTDAADLSGVSTVPLRVDAVVHQARLRVDEKGAEGAAATAMMVRVAGMAPRPPVPFVVDRPFRVVVRRRGAILFLGTVTDPHDPGPAR